MIVNGIAGFFPLMNIRPNFVGYYMTANGDIYSTRKDATPRKMHGAPANRGSRLYTFSPTGPSGKAAPVMERGDTLFAVAKRHSDWDRDTNMTKDTLTTMPALPPRGHRVKIDAVEKRDHAPDISAGIKQKGYIVGKVEGEAIVFGSKPKIHTTLESVKSEVTRLAAKSPGTKIIYVKIEGAATANAIAWQ